MASSCRHCPTLGQSEAALFVCCHIVDIHPSASWSFELAVACRDFDCQLLSDGCCCADVVFMMGNLGRTNFTLVCVRRLEQETIPAGGAPGSEHCLETLGETPADWAAKELSLSHDRCLLSRVDASGRPCLVSVEFCLTGPWRCEMPDAFAIPATTPARSSAFLSLLPRRWVHMMHTLCS